MLVCSQFVWCGCVLNSFVECFLRPDSWHNPQVDRRQLNNRQLDKLVVVLGRSKALWRRALTLYQWLVAIGHVWDDRLCTTFIRVCSQHGQAALAIELYEWMQKPPLPEGGGGAGLRPTVFTYTAVMRAALSGNMVDKAYQVILSSVVASSVPTFHPLG